MECSTCKKPLSFFASIKARRTKRCDDCNVRFYQIVGHWQQNLERAFRQGGVSKELEQALYQQFSQTGMPEDLGRPMVERLRYLRGLSEIQWGNIPIIRTTIHLDSDEMAHFEWQVTYYKQNKNVKSITGRLLGTNKKCYFYSNTGRDNATIDWNNVGQIIEDQTTELQYDRKTGKPGIATVPVIHLSVSRGSGGGKYQVPDTLYAKVLMDTLVRIWKRQLVLYKEQANHGAVPEHIKAAVFQRDQGRCRQCGYEGIYIEYDHVIPRSKGGPNTVENIQLLCRMCNLKKSDRL